jgi:hypothetical protein
MLYPTELRARGLFIGLLCGADTKLRGVFLMSDKKVIKKVLRFDGRAIVLCYLQKKKPLDLSGFSSSISIIA